LHYSDAADAHAHRGKMDELAQATAKADKVLVF
jgi:hypothetical protein